MSSIDEADRLELVQVTAAFRYSVRWEDLRCLLAERGHLSDQCVPLPRYYWAAENSLGLILADTKAVLVTYLRHPRTQQIIHIIAWNEITEEDRWIDPAKSFAAGADATFDVDVCDYFAEKISANDKPIAPKPFRERWKDAEAISALPWFLQGVLAVFFLGLLAGAWVLIWLIAHLLAWALGMSADEPVIDHPNGLFWFAGFVFSMVTFLCLAYVVGFAIMNRVAVRILTRRAT